MSSIASTGRPLRLEQGEGRPLFLLSLSLFLIIGSTAVIGRTAGRALFLSGLPPQYIPVRFLAVTVGVVMTSLLYARMAGRVRTIRLIQLTTLAMLGGLFVFRLLLDTAAAANLWLLGSFYVFLEVVMALSIVQFWTFAAEIVNTRRAKTLFPLITGAGNLGSMLAGAAVAVLVPWLGTVNLIYVIMLALGIYILLVRAIGRTNQDLYVPSFRADPIMNKPRVEQPGALGLLRRSPLLLTMTLTVVLITLAVNLVDYQFDLSLKSNFAANPQQLSAFLGSFYFWSGIAGLLLQVFLSGPLMRRFGIAAALMVMPISILTGSILVLASGAALWAVTLTRSSDTVFRYTVHDTSFNLLYVPVPHQLRSQARALIDGIFKPLTIGLSGILFFLAGRSSGIAVLPWSYAAILVALAVGLVLLHLRTVYRKALNHSIRRRYFDPAGEAVDFSSPATVETIKESLLEANEAEVLHALTIADEIGNVDWTPSLLPLIKLDSPLVRRQALRMLRHTQPSEYADMVRRHLADPESEVQASAIFTYLTLRGGEALEEVRPFMKSSDPQIRTAALSGALRYGDEATRHVARTAFASLVADPRQAMRIAAANALGEMPSEDGVGFLSLLLADSEPQVRRRAVQSAGQLADSRHLVALITQLDDPMVGTAAEEAIVRYGIEIFPVLETAYAEQALTVSVRRQIPGVIARINCPQSVRFLMRNLSEPDDLTRARLYIALGRLRQAGRTLTERDLAAVNVRLTAETRLAYYWAIRASSSQPQSPSNRDLLDDAYLWRKRYAIDRLLYLIGILYPEANIAQLRANLFGGDQRRRANAVELLDTLLSHKHKELILPLLEGPPERIMAIAEREFRLQLPSLESEYAAAVKEDDPWLAAGILFSLSGQQADEFSDLIRQGLGSPHDLVRETAELVSTRRRRPEPDQVFSPAYKSQARNSSLSGQPHHYLRLHAIES